MGNGLAPNQRNPVDFKLPFDEHVGGRSIQGDTKQNDVAPLPIDARGDGVNAMGGIKDQGDLIITAVKQSKTP